MLGLRVQFDAIFSLAAAVCGGVFLFVPPGLGLFGSPSGT
jgi:hypothetical protein